MNSFRLIGGCLGDVLMCLWVDVLTCAERSRSMCWCVYMFMSLYDYSYQPINLSTHQLISRINS